MPEKMEIAPGVFALVDTPKEKEVKDAKKALKVKHAGKLSYTKAEQDEILKAWLES